MREAGERRLFVAWRDPGTEAIHPVGLLTIRWEGSHAPQYTFAYLQGALDLEGFNPLPSFPEIGREYQSRILFPLFQNRMMPRARADYGSYLSELDLEPGTDPFIVLARSGGRKETDRIEVFPEPRTEESTGRLVCEFFARGIRHMDGAESVIEMLHEGDRLDLKVDEGNPYNPRALLMHSPSQSPVGYVPDYLVDTIHHLLELCGGDLVVSVAHINPRDVSAHMRLLCHMDSCQPSNYRPFSDPAFEPFVTTPAIR